MPSGPSNAQDLVLSVNRGNGETTLSNGGASATDFDGYFIDSANGLLSPAGWTSLASRGVAGWAVANPTAQHLTELNLVGTSGLEGGAAVSLGGAYNGLHVLPSQEDLGFQFTTPNGNVHDGVVQMVGASRVPILTVNRANGTVSLGNLSSGSFTVDSYSIASPNNLLIPAGWTSLASQNVEGWSEANPTEQLISELNLPGSTTFDGGLSFDLGAAYNSAAGVAPADENLSLAYSTPDGLILNGLVQYTGPINDLVLSVNTVSGEAAIQNLSSHTDSFDITGYSIFSASDGLSVESWNSFAQSGAAGEGWTEASPAAGALAELNPSSSKVFDEGTQIPIGSIFTPGNPSDLSFQYSTLAGVQFGTVEYVAGGGVPGDCNGDGVLDAADLACVSTMEDRDAVLAALNTLPGDLDGNGDVAFPDFLTLSANFGMDLASYTAGNIDLTGGVAFPDFLTLSANFGQTPAAGATAASVPEPTAGMLFGLSLLVCLHGRRRR